LTGARPPGYVKPMAGITLRLICLVAAVAAGAVLASASGTGAQTQPTPPQPPGPKEAPPPAMTPPAPGAKRGSAALPKTPEEREKTLSDLYALLATADDEDSAKAIAEAIERIWLHSGSATIDLLMERSMKAVSEKNQELALKLLDHIVELAPDFTEAWNRRAYVHFVRNEIELALGDLRRALALDPNHFKALDGLGQILREIGQKKAALQAFKQLLEIHPYWSGAQQLIDELAREVEGQGI
jgi:tetratricopeptide (TPR) repeat protein